MKGYVKVSDIEKYCQDAIEVHEKLIEKALDGIKNNEPFQSASAAAYFMQQLKIYKHDIPDMLKHLQEQNDEADEHISTLDLPTGVFNILVRHSVVTVGGLSEMTITELKNMRGLGLKGLNCILNKMSELGYNLKN